MFRRRRMLRRSLLADDQLAVLVNANQAMAQGKFLEAASLFAQVAQATQGSGHPRHAANLYARAAHAFADGKDAQQAFSYARQGLRLFALAGRPRRAAEFYANITPKLERLGMSAAAQALQAESGGQIATSLSEQIPTQPRHGLLPTNCPKCGAPLHAEEADWVDEKTVQCDYCGALIRSE
jgi:Soluble NSF attachment protein, SNAP